MIGINALCGGSVPDDYAGSAAIIIGDTMTVRGHGRASATLGSEGIIGAQQNVTQEQILAGIAATGEVVGRTVVEDIAAVRAERGSNGLGVAIAGAGLVLADE